MTQFNRDVALKLFKENPSAIEVMQDSDGTVKYVDNWKRDEICIKRGNFYCYGMMKIHPDGWDNSLYSRFDFSDKELL